MFFRKSPTQEDETKQLQRLKHLAQGTRDLDALATSLESPSLPIRTEAARLLGEVGDATSLTPLKTALLKAYSGRSPRLHRILGVLETTGLFTLGIVLLGLICGVGMWLLSCAPVFGGVSPPSFFDLWDSASEHRRKNDPFIRAVLNSIDQLVEKHSAVELKPLIPALKTIAADSHHHRDLTRTAALNAISSIQAVAWKVGELPISSQAKPADPSELPVVEGGLSERQHD